MGLQKLRQKAHKGSGSKGTLKSLLAGTKRTGGALKDNTQPKSARTSGTAKMDAAGRGRLR